MKDLLAPVKNNPVIGKVFSEVSKFYTAHESAILTGGTIGFSLATTGVTLRNAARINYILSDAKGALDNCNTKEEKNHVYAITLKEIAPLVIPILIFQTLTIITAVKQKKQSDKKIAEMAGALSIANSAIAQYQAWQKQTEEALGEKKYEKLQNDIYKNQEIDGRRFSSLPMEGAPGEVLMVDKYSGKPFWANTSTVENAAKMLSTMLATGSYDILTLDDFYEQIGNNDLTNTTGQLTSKFGYAAGGYGTNDIYARFADTHYVFPNGTKIPAFMVYLYPEPACVDFEI